VLGYIFENPTGPAQVALHFAANDSKKDVILFSDTNLVAPPGYDRQGVAGYMCAGGYTLPAMKTIHRYWDPSQKQHFYTTSDKERADVERAGYRYEGVTAYIWAERTSQFQYTQKPLYRLYRPERPKHLYTANEAEKNALLQQGFIVEAIMGYANIEDYGLDGTPLYRLYNPSINDHFYTTNQAEAEAAARSGYKFEATQGLVNPYSGGS
jgi:uncharacterized protein DUF5648